jgi:hypothetical protein
VKTGSYGSDFVVGSLIDMNYKCRCFKEALGFFFLRYMKKKGILFGFEECNGGSILCRR